MLKKLLSVTTVILLLAYSFTLARSADLDTSSIAVQVFTCPMHPEVRSTQSDQCPKCNMKLIRVQKTNTNTHRDDNDKEFKQVNTKYQGVNSIMLMGNYGVTDTKTGFGSVGLGYEYLFPQWNHLFGLGVMAELMIMKMTHMMWMFEGSVHPYHGLFLQTGIGTTHKHIPATADHPMRMSPQSVYRLTCGVDQHLSNFMISPYFNIDFAENPSTAFSAGICIGYMK